MIREDFPIAGSDYLGGESDGWEYRTIFSSTTLDLSYEMVRQFLAEEGYEDIPLPETAKELRLFRLPKQNNQLLMFGNNGYVHNPVKILFLPQERRPKSLMLCLYNEKEVGHLLRFHGLKTSK
jgi:hypothetical protein